MSKNIIKCVTVKNLKDGKNRIFMKGNEKLNIGDKFFIYYDYKYDEFYISTTEQVEVIEIFDSSDDIEMFHFVIPIISFPKTREEYFQAINTKSVRFVYPDENLLMNKDILIDYWPKLANEGWYNCTFRNETLNVCEKNLLKLIDKKQMEIDDVPKKLMTPVIFMRICKTDLNKYHDVLIKEIEAGRIPLVNLPVKLRHEKEYILPLVKNHPSVYKKKIPDELKKDKDIALAAIHADPLIFYYAPAEIKNNREIALEAVKCEGYVLKYLNKELRHDDEIVYEAFKSAFKTINDWDYRCYNTNSMLQFLDKDYTVRDKNIAKKILTDMMDKFDDPDLAKLVTRFSEDLKNDEDIKKLFNQWSMNFARN